MIFTYIGLVLCLHPPGSLSNKVNITALSTEFLLGFPKLRDPNIYLLIYTLAEKIMVTISLTNPGSSNHTLLEDLEVLKLKSVQHRLDKDRVPTPPKEYSHHSCLLLTSDQPFGVHVHMYDGSRALSSFMAVPIQAFGKAYTVITHKTRSFFTVVAEHKTKIYVSLVITPSHNLVVEGAVRPVGVHNWRTVDLDSYQAFSLTKCFENRFLTKISLTGSIIESNHPIGVISGSCSLNDDACQEPAITVSYPDMAAEMLLPEKMLGLNFLIVFCRKTSSFDNLFITTSQPDTLLLIYTNESAEPNKLHFPTKGTKNVSLLIPDTYVTSTFPVAIYYYVTSTCQGSGDKGGPSIMMIVPNELFYNTYVWVNPPAVDVVNFINLVIPEDTDVENVQWNGGSIPYMNKTVNEVWIHSTYVLVTLEMRANSSEAVLKAPFTFGCYFSGVSFGSFFQAAGFMYNDEKLDCSVSTKHLDDGKDNDCDGLVDEEHVDLLDDDGDGLIDEDTYNKSECQETGRRGKNCLLHCSDFCLTNCFPTGTCHSCVDGRTNVKNFCFDECPVYTYGRYCKDDCAAKCNGSDCFERSEGQCGSLDNTKKAERTTQEPSDETKLEGSSFLTWTVLMLILISAVAGILGIIFISPKGISWKDDSVATDKQVSDVHNDLPFDIEATGGFTFDERTSVSKVGVQDFKKIDILDSVI